MIIQTNKLTSLVEKGLATRRIKDDLSLWNYTPQAQYSGAFKTEPDLLMCRGLVTEDHQDSQVIVARPFHKFFNLQELTVRDLPVEGEYIEVTDKLDGSLVIVSRYKNKIHVNTRGAFNSKQAIAARQLFNTIYDFNWIEEGKTYLFEYVAPDNRIVVTYKIPDLILIAIIDNETGRDLPRVNTGFRCVGSYVTKAGPVMSLTSIVPEKPNNEGYVIRRLNEEDQPSQRIKVKYFDYLQLHKILTGTNEKTVWEYLSQGKLMSEMFATSPDEFLEWAKKTASNFEAEYQRKLEDSLKVLEIVKTMPRKDAAQLILADHKELASIVFAMLDGKDVRVIIWKTIKPDPKQTWQT